MQLKEWMDGSNTKRSNTSGNEKSNSVIAHRHQINKELANEGTISKALKLCKYQATRSTKQSDHIPESHKFLERNCHTAHQPIYLFFVIHIKRRQWPFATFLKTDSPDNNCHKQKILREHLTSPKATSNKTTTHSSVINSNICYRLRQKCIYYKSIFKRRPKFALIFANISPT